MTHSARIEFADRVRDFGGHCWWSDAQADLVAAPQPTEFELKLLASDSFKNAAVAVRSESEPTVSDHSPSSWLVALAEPDGSFAVVMGESVRSLKAIRHFHHDLQQTDALETASVEFSERLSQSFEEVNLIFRMARILHRTEVPFEVMRMLCDDLKSVLPFGWLAFQFAAEPQVLEDLRGKLLVAGDHKVPTGDFVGAAKSICDQTDGPVIRVQSSCPLAAATGAEVLAQPVHHEGVRVGMIIAGNRTAGDSDISSNETQIVSAAAGFLGLFHENASRFASQKKLFMGTLQALTAAVDAKDPYTRGHSDRVGLIASKMAFAMNLGSAQVENYRIAGWVHDVGKIGVPEAVLRKPGRLDEAEFEQIKKHPETGYGILKDIEALANINPGVLSHHERWDGKGYPQALAGEKIPLIARVLALADTFDAMSSSRSYRAGMPREKVLAEIARSAGTQFDPALLPYFLQLDFTDFDTMLGTPAKAA